MLGRGKRAILRPAKVGASLLRSPRMQPLRRAVLLNVVGFLLNIPFALIFIYFSANVAAQSIKADNSPELEVQYRSYSGSTEQVIERDLRLIGATQKVVFL